MSNSRIEPQINDEEQTKEEGSQAVECRFVVWEEPAILFERSLLVEAGGLNGLPGAGRLNPLNASNMMGSCSL